MYNWSVRFIVKIIALGVFLWVLITALRYWGIPVKKEYTKGPCTTEYKSYLLSRDFCQSKTGGHCASEESNLLAAKFNVARCLCEKYESTQDESLASDIRDICEDTYCKKAAEVYECKYYLMGTECPYENELPSVSVLCSDPDTFFPPIRID